MPVTSVVAVLNQKGGVGKPAVTLGLASAAWAAGMKTLVVDLAARAVVETVRGYPLPDFWRLGAPRPAPPTVHFFVDAKGGAIVRRDFATGEEHVVAGVGAPPGERLRRPTASASGRRRP